MIDDITLEQLIKTSNGPLAVLFACLLLQKQKDVTIISEESIAKIMDRTEKTVRGHMHQLAEIGFITRTSRGWVLTTLGRMQLLEVAQYQIGSGDLPDATGKNYRYDPENGIQPVKTTGDDSVVVVIKDLNDFKESFNSQQQQNNFSPVKITGDEDPEIDRILSIGECICRAANIYLDTEIWPAKMLAWLKKYETRRSFHPENRIHGLSIICGWMAQIHERPPANIKSSMASIVISNVISDRMPQANYLNNYYNYFSDVLIDRILESVYCLECWQEKDNCHCE